MANMKEQGKASFMSLNKTGGGAATASMLRSENKKDICIEDENKG